MIKRNKKEILIILGLIVLVLIVHTYYRGITLEVVRFQNKKLIEITKGLKHGKNIYLTMIALFFYGVGHSLGPGHGKAIISSTSLVEKSYKKIFKLSFLITYLQGISALFLVILLDLIEKKLKIASIEKAGSKVQLLTSIIILVISTYLMFNMVFKNNKKNKNIDVKKEEVSDIRKNPYYIAFLVGIIPCYGVINILLFLRILHLSKYDIMSVFFITTGMFFVVSSFGIITLKLKKTIVKRDNKLLKTFKFIGLLFIFLYTLNYLSYYLSIN